MRWSQAKETRQKEWEREHSCWRVEILSLLDLYSFFFTMLSSLPHSLAAVASSCKGVPALPRSPHTKPSLSPRCRQANNGQPLMQFTRSQGRDVLLGISRVPLAQTPQLPLLWESVTWRSRFSRGPFQGQCVWSWMSAEHWFYNVWVGCFCQRYHFHSCHENEAVIAHMCSSVERFPSSHDKDRWKSLISISFWPCRRRYKTTGTAELRRWKFTDPQ